MKIGVSGPFTGKRSAYGDLIKASTFQIAKEMGLENTVEFIFIDDKAQVADALKAAKAFIKHNVNAVIGHFNSECAKNVAKEYHANQMLFIAPASTAIQIPYENQGYIYRTCPTNQDQINLLKTYLLKHEISKLGIFKDGTPYSEELFAITKKELTKVGIEILDLTLADNIQNIDTFWFLGTHHFCMDTADEVQKMATSTTLLFCDDCYIDEFITHFATSAPNNNRIVVGLSHKDGYKNCYKKALKALITHLLYAQKFVVEKEKWKLYKI